MIEFARHGNRPPSLGPALQRLEPRELPAGSFLTAPVVPTLDAVTQAHLQAVFQRGQELGNRADVFAKAGDSITWLPQAYKPLALSPLGIAAESLDAYWFFRGGMAGDTDPFSRPSTAALPTWTSLHVLAALPGELDAIKPAFALIEIGTNDVTFGVPLSSFRANLTAIVQTCLDRGVVPVLGTVPPKTGPFRGELLLTVLYNQTIAEVAEATSVPLWNTWATHLSLPNLGMSDDGVHPSDLGFAARNLAAVNLLAELKARLVEIPVATPWVPLTGRFVAAVGLGGGSSVVRLADAFTGESLGQFVAYERPVPGGVHVAAADVTGDGVLDIITAPGFGGGPHVKVFDGTSGAEVAGFLAYDPAFLGGVWVTAADVTGDGRAEIVTAPEFGPPHIKEFSGLDGRERQSFFAAVP